MEGPESTVGNQLDSGWPGHPDRDRRSHDRWYVVRGCLTDLPSGPGGTGPAMATTHRHRGRGPAQTEDESDGRDRTRGPDRPPPRVTAAGVRPERPDRGPRSA